MRDPAIGITFERGEPIAALCEESGFPADIVLWHGCKGKKQADIERAEHVAARAGHALIADHPHRIGHAA
ncbi:hypothetical protein [Sphingomonas sp. PAMC 26605]|uniref:hypothetical protein n=1 Tax=Sphingomonas sp. PAMC 26605 TaxID=1112214 RepID=UPI0018DEE625|nr:hypothetical protein [Sphingomonas sp. PAMC 26605]